MIKYFRDIRNGPDYSYSHYVAGEKTHTPGDLLSHLYVTTRYTPRYDQIYYSDMYDSSAFPNEWESMYKKGSQIGLFRHHTTPASNEVQFVEGTERGRTHFPMLLSIINNESMAQHGVPLTPSHDLSEHSLKFVNNLQRKGIVGDDPDIPGVPTNNMTFERYPDIYPASSYKQISVDEVKEGKESLRKMLKASRNLSSQFTTVQPEQHHQLELDL